MSSERPSRVCVAHDAAWVSNGRIDVAVWRGQRASAELVPTSPAMKPWELLRGTAAQTVVTLGR